LNITFKESAFAQYREWAKTDKNVFKKLDALITEVLRTPFHGTGKPEPLKGNRSGQWSRRSLTFSKNLPTPKPEI
jgi:toxin YoeB